MQVQTEFFVRLSESIPVGRLIVLRTQRVDIASRGLRAQTTATDNVDRVTSLI